MQAMDKLGLVLLPGFWLAVFNVAVVASPPFNFKSRKKYVLGIEVKKNGR